MRTGRSLLLAWGMLDLLPNPDADIEPLATLLDGRKVVVLAGAGCSTESGIPDYRGPIGRTRKRDPIRYLDFVQKPAMRQRYWARSAVGWPAMREATPNPCHLALAALEHAGVVHGMITQNVDGLHQRAGQRDVIELHGALGRVYCMGCGARTDRDAFQAQLLAANPRFESGEAAIAPDGDAMVRDAAIAEFVVPDCAACGGIVKPDVIFFGENVPKPRVELAWSKVAAADVLLVVGSSLTVWSGYRFVRGAAAHDTQVAIVGLGETRGDPEACLRLEARLGVVLPRLATRLGVSR